MNTEALRRVSMKPGWITVGSLCLAAIASAPTSGAHATASDWLKTQTAGLQRVRGTYDNNQYGYSVAVPPSLSAWMTIAPSPNHGINIILGDHRIIYVSAEYDAPLYGSARAALDAGIEYTRPRGAARVTRTHTSLGGKPAEEAVVTGRSVTVSVLQWLPLELPNAIIYDVTLVTTPAHARADRRTFHAVLATFRHMLPEQ